MSSGSWEIQLGVSGWSMWIQGMISWAGWALRELGREKKSAKMLSLPLR